MPDTDREVFDKLTDQEGGSAALSFISYALFAYERREWIDHFEARHGKTPTQAEIDEWTANVTEGQFTKMRAQAASFFDAAAREYLEADIAAEKDEVLRSSILREVRAAGSLWKQLLINLATGIIAPFIIGGMIFLGLLFSDRFPSIRDLSGGGAPAVARPAPSPEPH